MDCSPCGVAGNKKKLHSCTKTLFSVRVCHQTMSSTWGYAIPVTEEVLAMRGRGGCTKSWWGFLSALFSYMYLSVCGLQNSSPEGPTGTHSVWHCHYWTAYKCCGLQDWKHKEIVFLFLISGWQRLCLCTYLLEVKWSIKEMADLSIISGNSKYGKISSWFVSNWRKNLRFFVRHPLHFLLQRFVLPLSITFSPPFSYILS